MKVYSRWNSYGLRLWPFHACVSFVSEGGQVGFITETAQLTLGSWRPAVINLHWDRRHHVHICICDCSVLRWATTAPNRQTSLCLKRKNQALRNSGSICQPLFEYGVHYSSDILLCVVDTKLSVHVRLCLLSRYRGFTFLTPFINANSCTRGP